MKKTILALMLFPSICFGADFFEQGTPVPYNAICFDETSSQNLLGDIETAKSIEQELAILQKKFDTKGEMCTNIEKQAEAYKQSYTDVKGLLDTQIDITKKSTEHCKEILEHSKPSIMTDVWKIMSGVGIGLLIAVIAL